jgi:hypothetical protein
MGLGESTIKAVTDELDSLQKWMGEKLYVRLEAPFCSLIGHICL